MDESLQCAVDALRIGQAALTQLGAAVARPLLRDAVNHLANLSQWDDDLELRAEFLASYGKALVADGAALEGSRVLQSALAAMPHHTQARSYLAQLVDVHLAIYAKNTSKVPGKATLSVNWQSMWDVKAIVRLVDVALQNGNALAAEIGLRWAVAIEPKQARWWDRLCDVLASSGHAVAAVACGREATRLFPDKAMYWRNLAYACNLCGRSVEQLEAAKHAVALEPSADSLSHLSAAHYNLCEYLAAEKAAREALLRKPGHMLARTNLGAALAGLDKISEALTEWYAVLAQNEGNEPIFNNLIAAHIQLGEYNQARVLLRRALTLFPDSPRLLSLNAMELSYSPDLDACELFEAHLAYGRAMQSLLPQKPPTLHWDGVRRLRVGLVSSDLGQHPVGYFVKDILLNLTNYVDVVGYATQLRVGEIKEKIKASATEWVECAHLDDEMLVRKIRRDKIDILVDLNGHTLGHRLGVFARKAAPIQATWLGYFATTGLASMDWIISDEVTLPLGNERFFTERPCRINPCYLSFSPHSYDIEINPLPLLGKDACVPKGPVFGCFNNLVKINPSVLGLWSRLLEELPGSTLLIKTGQLSNRVARNGLTEKLKAAGFVLDRVTLEGGTPHEDHLRQYHRIDIALDTFPYPGGTTSAEALWMGVPVVSLRGGNFLGRVGASILTAVGLDNWVADSPDDYIRIVRSAVRDPASLALLRCQLRNRLMTSEFVDAAGFANKLGQAFTAMAQIKTREQGGKR